MYSTIEVYKHCLKIIRQ